MELDFECIAIEKDEGTSVILGHAGFIKTVEDLYEAMVGSVPGVKFGIAFAEASGPRLVRSDGNEDILRRQAESNILKIAAGHTFLILFKEAYPINVINNVRNVSEVATIYCATSNPVQVIVAKADTSRSVIGIVDGFNGNASTRQVPHISGNPTARSHHAHHFCDCLDRVGNKANHKSHGRGVETSVRIWQCLRVTDAKFRQLGLGPRARVAELTFRRIDGAHRGRSAPRDQNLRKCAVATANVEPAQAFRNSKPIKECFTHDAATTTHASFIGFPISEKLFIVAHANSLVT